jgi:hypothetical protein
MGAGVLDDSEGSDQESGEGDHQMVMGGAGILSPPSPDRAAMDGEIFDEMFGDKTDEFFEAEPVKEAEEPIVTPTKYALHQVETPASRRKEKVCTSICKWKGCRKMAHARKTHNGTLMGLLLRAQNQPARRRRPPRARKLGLPKEAKPKPGSKPKLGKKSKKSKSLKEQEFETFMQDVNPDFFKRKKKLKKPSSESGFSESSSCD